VSFYYAHGGVTILASDVATTMFEVNCADTITGVAFAPAAVKFLWNGIQGVFDSASMNLQRGIGFAVSPTSRRCVSTFSQDAAATSNCGGVARNDAVICTTDGAAGSDGEVDIASFDADGFTLVVDDALPQNLAIWWEAWGGDEITVAAVGDITEPAATGGVDYTVTGFDAVGLGDPVVIFCGCQSGAAVNTAASVDSGFMIGYATGAGAQNIVLIGNSDDGSATMDTDGYGRGDECLGMIVVAGGTGVSARAALTQFGVDNFRLNWAARATTNRRYIFLAMKGGRWRVGDLTIDVTTLNATAIVTGLPFYPKGLSAMTRWSAEQTSNSAAAEDRMSWGTGARTNSVRSLYMRDTHGVDPSAIEVGQDASVILYQGNGTAPVAGIDINAMNYDGFQLAVDDEFGGGSATTWVGYLVCGHVSPSPPDVVMAPLKQYRRAA